MLKFAILIVLLWILSGSVLALDRITGKNFASRSEVIARNGMVASSHPLATQIGIDVLKRGGTATDAAIAVNAALGLMEPTGSGIGGDLFAIVWDAKAKKLYGLNASGRSPGALTLDEFRKRGLTEIPPCGPLPVTVPGCVDGWFELHGRFGKLPIADLLAPTVRYARDGFPVTELIAHYWERSVPRLSPYAGFEDVFMPGGHAPKKGEIFHNPALANTLERIGAEGRDVFYKGDMARTMAAFMQREGGFLAYQDFAEHHSEWVEPVSTNYRGYDVWELPPNGQGIAALQMLNILEPYDIRSWGFGSVEYMHHFIEAKKLAFEDRAKYYADPAFNHLPVAELISKPYAETRRALIDDHEAADRYDTGNPALDRGDTVYLCTADADGNMVSLIQSNYRGMGSGLSPDGLGFIFQDRGQLFALDEKHRNGYAPKKRPFHTIIPGFVTQQGEARLAFGVMGGSTQPQAHVQVLINMIDFDMNLQEAGDAPRIVHNGSSQPTGEVMADGGHVVAETGFPYETLRELQQMGHDIRYAVGPYGGYQAIYRDAKGVLYGASESRKDGQAAGY